VSPSARGAVVVALVALAASSGAAEGQGGPQLRLERSDGSARGVSVEIDHGFAAVPASLLSELGWRVSRDATTVLVELPGEVAITLRLGSPFFRWDGVALQMTDAPYEDRGTLHVPLQLLTDFFPRRLPDLYAFDGPNATLTAGDPGAVVRGRPVPGGGSVPDGPSVYAGVRVVVIDPGHGGSDPGVLGPAGIREKDVALRIGLRLAEALGAHPDLEVHLIRDDDTFVDLWRRGEIATELKGDRPGVFVSIHANSVPGRRNATGFETYFLSEARTEHERRVSAIENAPMSFLGQGVDADAQPDIDFILRELRNLDHQHWSALLAEFVQEELDVFHPGPNRGVKQGVLAVLTNALMPSVLVEVGYLSDNDEARLLGRESFQHDAGEGIAEAVLRFFERYPPGAGLSDSGSRRE